MPARAQAPVDDERAWEDMSYGTGEALFTAVAVDPDDPKRVYAGANGAVYVSEDGGQTWTRVLRVRGSASNEQRAEESAEDDIEDEVADRTDELRDELLEEIKREITEELIAEYGEYGETLADEIAEDLAEQQLAEEFDSLAAEVREEIGRARAGRDLSALGSLGETQRRVEPRTVHRLLALPGGRLLVASGSGLFVSNDRGQTFDEHQTGIVPEERDVRAAGASALVPGRFFAGTLAGLFVTDDAGESWTEAGGFPGKLAVNDVAVHPQRPDEVLAATDQGVFLSVDGGRTFVAVHQPTSPLALTTNAVAWSPADPRIAYAGTLEGLFRSQDGGAEWERVEPEGLLTRQVQDLVARGRALVIASPDGVFLSEDAGESFRELYAGLDTPDVRRVAAGATSVELYAATVRGLFAYRLSPDRQHRLQRLSEAFERLRSEPSVMDVAREALRYAGFDVPVESWRRRSELAPLAPKVVATYGALNPWFDAYRLRTNLWTLPPTVYDYRDQRANWQVSLTWDASRWVFNSRTTTVSAAFRRIEKQRTRVLRRVVNTYNTRRRAQVTLIEAPPTDVRAYVQKQLQIDELTAVLDGLTDGYFSAQLAPSAAPRGEARSSSRTP